MRLLKWILGKKIAPSGFVNGNKSCICGSSFQSIGCPAYDNKTCIWHPINDPYGIKDREWVDGQFVKKKKC